jgi:hypothetical protein
VAVLSAPEVLGAILSDTILGFDMAIGSDVRWFVASGTPPARTGPLLVQAWVWRRVWAYGSDLVLPR